jgi:hypothetical protein
MKITNVLCTALLALSANAWATEQVQKVSGTVWKNGDTRAVFDLRVQAGETQQVPLHNGEMLEVSRSEAAGTMIRVLDPAGKQVTSAALGAGSADKSVRFAFCTLGGVEVSSPAFEGIPRCEAK